MLLAIDSSAGTSAAIVDFAGGILAEASSDDPLKHAEVVGELIREVLARSGTPVSALSAVALGVGPGPFTGLRVGMAAGRAFALGAGIPLAAVVSHDAVAASFYGAAADPHAARPDGASQADGRLLVTTDARRREAFWSLYSGADEFGIPIRIEGPSLAGSDRLSQPSWVPSAHRVDAHEISAGWLGMVAERTWAAGRAFPSADAVYLRSPDVTLSAPKRVTG
ncbi:MAG: tsaB [Thermoleophilia bacterium]|nr:tsaB [Thermoleophilia bacterium]